jgi:hypothetical protein
VADRFINQLKDRYNEKKLQKLDLEHLCNNSRGVSIDD